MMLPVSMTAAWRRVQDVARRDPSLFLVAFAMWSLISGVSFLLTADTFLRAPQYSVAAELSLNDNIIGAGMVLDGLVMLWCVGSRPPLLQTTIALMSSALWVFWSMIVIAGSYRRGVAAPGSLWSMLAAVTLMIVSTKAWSEPAPIPREGGDDA